MARYTVRKSYVDVVGKIWMPQHVTVAMRYPVSGYDMENMRDDDGQITRDSVEQWLMCHSGDFSSVEDFSASLEVGDDTIEFPWTHEESECTYADSMFPND